MTFSFSFTRRIRTLNYAPQAAHVPLARLAALVGAMLVAATLTSAPAARADSIGINFNGNDTTNNLAAATSAGVTAVAQTNWNNLGFTPGMNTSGFLNNSSGTNSGATLTYTALDTTTFTAGTITVAAGDEQLNNGYIYSNQNTATTFTLNNISYGTYDIYVYDLSRNGVRQQTTLGPTSFYSRSPNPFSPSTIDGNAGIAFTYTQATSTDMASPTPGANYVRFTGLSGTSQSFSVTGLTDLGRVGGIQVVQTATMATPEPSTWAMMFLGMGAMVLVTRRKRAADSDAI